MKKFFKKFFGIWGNITLCAEGKQAFRKEKLSQKLSGAQRKIQHGLESATRGRGCESFTVELFISDPVLKLRYAINETFPYEVFIYFFAEV